jgi:hypothetical protein
VKKLLAALLLFVAPVAANAQSSKSTIVSSINTNFADNTSGAITAALLRSVTTTMVSSYVDYQTCGIQGGIIYYASGVSPTCLQPGTAGQFLRTYSTPAWESIASILTAGTGIGITGTITPTIAVSDTELNGVQNLNGSTGVVVRTGSVTPVYVTRTLTGTINQITFTNGSGVSGNPTAVLSSLSTMLDDQLGAAQGGIIYRGASGWAFLSAGVSGQVFTTGGASANPSYTSVAGTGTMTSLTCGTGLTCSSNPITAAGTVTPTFATVGDYQSKTASSVIDPANAWAAAAPVSLTAASVVTPNFNTGFNFSLLVTGATTIGLPTNATRGQSGCLYLQQSAVTGTVSFYAGWKFAGGAAPPASTTANALDVYCYQVGRSVSEVVATQNKQVGP